MQALGKCWHQHTHAKGNDHEEREDEPRDPDAQGREDGHAEDDDTRRPSTARWVLAPQLVCRDALLVRAAEDNAREARDDDAEDNVEDQGDSCGGSNLRFQFVHMCRTSSTSAHLGRLLW
eukprot:COSAG03_NODE_2780_length_2456_cov_2.935936_2_plen_120_part_00